MKTSPRIALLTSTTSIAVALIALAFPSNASAETLFSNLGQSEPQGAGLSQTTRRWASEFLTGVDATLLTDLSVSIRNFDTIIHTINASLYADSGIGSGSPGSLLTAFTANDNSVAPGATELATFTLASVPLLANARYWIAVGNDQELADVFGGDVSWFVTTSNAADAGSSFTDSTPPNLFTSTNSGGSWSDINVTSNGMFSLQGTVVPEPSTGAMLTSVAIGLLALRRRSPRHF